MKRRFLWTKALPEIGARLIPDFPDFGNEPVRFWISFTGALLAIASLAVMVFFSGAQAADSETVAATWSDGALHVMIPYHALSVGAGQLTVEVLDPEDHVLGRSRRLVELDDLEGAWQEDVKLTKTLAIEDLVWHRLHYRFAYGDNKDAAIEGTESISQILRSPVIHILGQQSYVAGGQAAVRVIASDSRNECIAGPSSVRIELIAPGQDSRPLFTGQLNRHGTAEAQFRFPTGLVGDYRLRYVLDTPIGSTELTQPVRLQDKVSILLTTEKPIYQPGQTIHVRALALDRANHAASSDRKLTFELEDRAATKS